jgi:hypothetical protein
LFHAEVNQICVWELSLNILRNGGEEERISESRRADQSDASNIFGPGSSAACPQQCSRGLK